MCQSCSQFGCFECLTKWVAENRACPHCRTKKNVTDFVKVPIISQILEKVKLAEQFACESHETQTKDLFCIDCDAFYCHECVLFDKSHPNHTFRKRSEINLEQKAKVDALLADGQQGISAAGVRIAICNSELDALTKQKEEFTKFIVQIEQAFQEELNSRKSNLTALISSTKDHLALLQMRCQEIKKTRNIQIQIPDLSEEPAVFKKQPILHGLGIDQEEIFNFQVVFKVNSKIKFQLHDKSSWILNVERQELENQMFIGIFCIMEHSRALGAKDKYFVSIKMEGVEKKFVKEYAVGASFGFKKFVPSHSTETILEVRMRRLGIN